MQEKAMKRFVVFACLLVALLLAGCGAPDSIDAAAQAAYVFQSGEAAVTAGDDMAQVLPALGEPKSYFEAPSCAFDGLDKTYTYPGFVITTQPEGEKDLVNAVVLTDDSVTTPEGIYIGSSPEDVRGAYGTPAEEGETALIYTRGGVKLTFILENGKVCSIEYLIA